MSPRFLVTTTAILVGLVVLGSATTGCRRKPPRQPQPPTAAERDAGPPSATTTVAPTASAAPTAPPEDKSGVAQMSDAERKAAARAAYGDGVELQKKKDCEHALPRFETAQRLFDAPTHVLHIAQCQAAVGRLVEAQESYATLSHLALPPGSPPAFREAKEAGKAELPKLTPRVPTLRVETNPPASSLKNVVVQVNGTQMPSDLIGVPRPLNPGRYRVTVTASPNRSGSGEMELKEGEAKSLEVKLSP